MVALLALSHRHLGADDDLDFALEIHHDQDADCHGVFPGPIAVDHLRYAELGHRLEAGLPGAVHAGDRPLDDPLHHELVAHGVRAEHGALAAFELLVVLALLISLKVKFAFCLHLRPAP